MRDPYDILGVARDANFEQVKAAYRRASKSKHPDLGGSDAEFIELRTAYEQVLKDLKRGYEQQREEPPRQQQRAEEHHEQRERHWERAYRDIDDELEELRREAEARDEALRAMRTQAWEAGERATWARLTWDDLVRFIRTIVRSGIKGLALLFAALVGIGSVLVQANVISSIIILGSGIGVLLSLAFKNDKGGMLSAGLLLFGIMTIWLPPVRAALFTYPLATISVLICLGLIFKFAQQGGVVGLMTGGVLALYVIFVIAGDSQRPEQQISRRQPAPEAPTPPPGPSTRPTQPPPQVPAPPERRSAPPPAPSPPAAPPGAAPAPAPEPPPEPRTLLAAKGAVLKFVAGVPYQLKIRTGFTTLLHTSQGTVAFYSGDNRVGECTDRIELAMRAGSSPYQEIDRMIRACGSDAIARVVDVR